MLLSVNACEEWQPSAHSMALAMYMGLCKRQLEVHDRTQCICVVILRKLINWLHGSTMCAHGISSSHESKPDDALEAWHSTLHSFGRGLTPQLRESSRNFWCGILNLHSRMHVSLALLREQSCHEGQQQTGHRRTAE